ALLGEHTIAAIAIDLQDTAEAVEVGDRTLGLAIGRIDIGDTRRVASLPWPIITGVSPELAGLGPAAAGIEHRRGRFIGEELRRDLQSRKQPFMHRTQMPSGAADPIGKRGAVEIDTLSGVDLRLAVKWQVISVFGDQYLGDRSLGRQTALDHPGRRWSLDDDVLTGPAGVFRPPHYDHAQLRRHDVEPLADVFADPMKTAAAARAAVVLDVDNHLHTRQMRRQRATVRPSPGNARRTL